MNISFWFRCDHVLVIETQKTQDHRDTYEFPWALLYRLGCFDKDDFDEKCSSGYNYNFHKDTKGEIVPGNTPTSLLPEH